MMRLALFAGLFAGCASGTNRADQADSPGTPQDAKQYLDAPSQGEFLDAPAHPPVDAGLDAFVYRDAPVVMHDAPPDACVPVVTQMLANPAFDASPVATGWTEVQFNSTEEVTNDAVQSAPYSLFLGGWVGYGTVTDQAYQDIAIPANATAVAITGYVGVGTMETTTTTVYDSAQVGLVQPADSSPIETAVSVSNLTNTGGGFVTFSHSFAVAGIAGHTVRVRLTSTSDDTNNTNFFFDTLQLNVTHCP
jgi:hypothetical protein